MRVHRHTAHSCPVRLAVMLPEYDSQSPPPADDELRSVDPDGPGGMLAVLQTQPDHERRQLQAAAEAAARLTRSLDQGGAEGGDGDGGGSRAGGGGGEPVCAERLALQGDAAAAAALLAATTSMPVNSIALPAAAFSTGGAARKERTHSQEASPEKRLRTQECLPSFGDARAAEGAPAHRAPPLFHGGRGDHPLPGPPPSSGPQHFLLDEPTWVGGLRDQLNHLHGKQDTALAQLSDATAQIQTLTAQMGSLGDTVRGHDTRLGTAEGRLGELEAEVRRLRSVSPSPAATRGSSPRFSQAGSSLPDRHIDDFQIVVGGWDEARRVEIEGEVTRLFSDAQAEALLKRVHVPYARSRYCRVELLFPDDRPRAKRELQGTVLHALRQRISEGSRLPGQGSARLWAKRNRGPEERAKIRAIVSMKALALEFVSETDVDFDWSGRVWVKGREILFHADRRPPFDGAVMLQNGRGEDTGWYVRLGDFAALLGVAEETLRQRLDLRDE